MNRKIIVTAVVLACAGFPAGAKAQSVDDRTAKQINARIYAMKSMKQAMSTIGTALSMGRVEDPIQLMYPVKTLSMASGRIEKLFPEGSLGGPSLARPAIWKDWPRFRDLADRTKSTAEAMLAATQGGDMAGLEKNFKQLGNLCTDCHRPFREED